MGYAGYAAEIAPYLSEGEILELQQQLSMVLPMLIRFLIGFGIAAGIIYVLFYVFFSLSVYTMSDRRGLSGSFLAWIPFLRQIQAGRVASDAYEQRTGKKAFYGVLIALLMFLPALIGIGAFFTKVPSWLVTIGSLLGVALSVVKIFARAEIFRDYSPRWVGMLIFSILCPFLVPIFLLILHKRTPLTAKHGQTPTAQVYSEPYTPPPAPQEPIVTPPPAPQEPIVTPPAEDVIDAAVAETAAAVEAAAEDAAEEVVGEI